MMMAQDFETRTISDRPVYRITQRKGAKKMVLVQVYRADTTDELVIGLKCKKVFIGERTALLVATDGSLRFVGSCILTFQLPRDDSAAIEGYVEQYGRGMGYTSQYYYLFPNVGRLPRQIAGLQSCIPDDKTLMRLHTPSLMTGLEMIAVKMLDMPDLAIHEEVTTPASCILL